MLTRTKVNYISSETAFKLGHFDNLRNGEALAGRFTSAAIAQGLPLGLELSDLQVIHISNLEGKGDYPNATFHSFDLFVVDAHGNVAFTDFENVKIVVDPVIS